MSIVFESLFQKRQKIEHIDYFHTLYLTFHIKFLNSTNRKLAISLQQYLSNDFLYLNTFLSL